MGSTNKNNKPFTLFIYLIKIKYFSVICEKDITHIDENRINQLERDLLRYMTLRNKGILIFLNIFPCSLRLGFFSIGTT